MLLGGGTQIENGVNGGDGDEEERSQGCFKWFVLVVMMMRD